MLKLVDLTNKNIVITGASSGIGKANAILCSKLGAKVILIGRDQAKLETTLLQMEGDGHLVYAMDITNFEQIDDLISEVVHKNGKISGFVHSAGIEMTRPLKILKQENWTSVFAINVFAGFEFAKSITKNKNIEDTASIIFISSIVGILGQPGKIAYGASKGALVSGVKSMALEFANRNIRVNAVLPALIETEMSNSIIESIGEEGRKNILNMHPMGFGKVEDVANSCAFILSDAAKWITGTEFIIDGGYSAS